MQHAKSAICKHMFANIYFIDKKTNINNLHGNKN